LAETKTQMPIVQRENKSPEFLMNELLDQFWLVKLAPATNKSIK
jgi:hypothetical protein